MPQGYQNQVAPLGGEQGIGTGWSRFGQGLFGGGTPGVYEDSLLTGMKAKKLGYDATKSLESAAIETLKRIAYENAGQHGLDLGLNEQMARGYGGFAQMGGGNAQQLVGGALDTLGQQTRNDMGYMNQLGGGDPVSSLNLTLEKPHELSTVGGGLQYGKWALPGGRNLMSQTPGGIADVALKGKRGFAAEEQGKLSRAKRENPQAFRTAAAGTTDADEADYQTALPIIQRGDATAKQFFDYFNGLGRRKLAERFYKPGADKDTEAPLEAGLDEEEAAAAKELGFDAEEFGGAGAVNSFLQGQPIENLPDEETAAAPAAAPAVGDLPPPRVVTDPVVQEAIMKRAEYWANQPGANIPLIEKLTEMQYGLQIKFGQPGAGGEKVKLRSTLYGPK